MLYTNRTELTLSFRLAGIDYSVPPGETCEISDEVAYCVSRRGLPLALVEMAVEPEHAQASLEAAIALSEVVAIQPKRRGRPKKIRDEELN